MELLLKNGTPFTYLQCQTKKVGTLPRLPLNQSAKKFVPNSWGQVDFAIRQVNSVLNLPNQQVKYFGTFKLRKNFNQSCSSPKKFGLVETTLGLKMLAAAYPIDSFPSQRVEWTGQIIFQDYPRTYFQITFYGSLQLNEGKLTITYYMYLQISWIAVKNNDLRSYKVYIAFEQTNYKCIIIYNAMSILSYILIFFIIVGPENIQQECRWKLKVNKLFISVLFKKQYLLLLVCYSRSMAWVSWL